MRIQTSNIKCLIFNNNKHQNSSKSHEYETVPLLQILNAKDLHKLIPAMSCLYVIACSGILLEIFPEAFSIITRLATSEWKILLKQIGYENRETGNASLSVFVCGSLVATLVFVCPLQNLTYIIAGANISAGFLRAFFFLYYPCRPRTTHTKRMDFFYFIKFVKFLIIFI